MNRMKNRKNADADKEASTPGRSELFTTTTELASAKASASAAEVAIPSNFRQR